MPVSMILEFAIAILSGAGVGWITNAIAVNMLFRKYGRWGGVIEEQYEAFIQNMSQLVEDDLVNHKTLQGEFNSPAFKGILYIWIEDILRKELPKKSGSIRFEEIPNIEQSVKQLIGLLQELDPILADCIYSVLEDKELQTVVSKEQYEYLVDRNVSKIFSADAPYQQHLKDILYAFLSDRVIHTLISQQAIDQLTENINNRIQTIDFSQFDKDIDTTYNALLQGIGIDQGIAELEQTMGQMQFSDFIKDANSLSQEFISRLIEFSATPEGQTLLLEIVNNLLDDAKAIPLKVDDVVSPAIKAGMVAFISEKLPGVIDRIADFFGETRDEIDQIINDTADRHLESSAGGAVLKVLKDLFIDDLAKHFNVVNKIISAIQKYGDTAGNNIANELLSFIETNSIGNGIAILQEQNIITPQRIVTLINLNLQDLSKKDYNIIEKLFSDKIEKIKPNLFHIKTVLLPFLLDKIKQNYLYQDILKKDLQSKATAKITEVVNRSCGELFSSGNIPLPLKDQRIKTYLLNLWDSVSVKKIGTLIPEKVTKHVRVPWESLWNRHKRRELNQVYQSIQKDAIYTKTTAWILEMVNQHLDKIITGNVSKFVNLELQKSSPSQIRVMVQEFIGKELKPINLFGAFLGSIVGGVSVWAASLLGVPREFTWWLFLIYGAIFAVVGIGTNWLAIKMLFRPYKKIVFSFSPFLGIVGARKPEFAKNISRFVKQRTFNDDALTEFFRSNKKNLQEKSSAWIANSDYLDALFRDEQRLNYIAGFIFSAIQNYITQHSDTTADSIAELLRTLISSGKLDDSLPLLRDAIIQKLYEKDITPYLYNFIKKDVEGKNLGHYTDRFSKALDLQIGRLFETLGNELNPEKIKQLLCEQNDQFVSYIATHSFEDFAGTPITAGLVQGISEKSQDILRAAIGPMVQYFENQDFNPDTKLRDLFNGKIVGFLEKHITYFLDMISQEIGTQRSVLVKQIKDAIPWYAAPAKGHVAPIVDLLMDEELPKFLKQKKEHILSIADSLLEYQVSHLGFNRDTLNGAMIEQALSEVLQSPHLQQSVTHFVQIIVEQYTRLIPLQSILTILNITTVQDLITILDPLLNQGISYIKTKVLQDDASDMLVKCTKELIGKIADGIAVSDILTGIDMEKEFQGFISLLLHDTAAAEGISQLLMDILLNLTKERNFYDDPILRKDLDTFITANLEQDWESLKLASIPLFKMFFQRLNKTITPETKQGIYQEYFIPAILDAGENRFTDIIHSIDIQTVVEREVNAMHPRKIEKLFYRFAGTYFTKITLYGWIGVFGGLLSYVIGCLLGWFLFQH
jgi:uncharacterized membrane protein YheB (UPF0754 family)